MRPSLLLPLVLFVAGCQAGAASSLPIHHVAFSPDGKWLVAAGGRLGKNDGRPWGGEGVAKVWETSNWKLHATWTDDFTDPIKRLFFVSKDVVATANNKILRDSKGSPFDGVLVRYWEIAGKKELPALHLKEARNAFVMSYYPPGKLIAYNPGDVKKVGVFTVPSLEKKCTLEGHPKGSRLLQFSPDGKTILSLSSEKPFVRLHDVATGKRIAEHNLDGVAPGARHAYAIQARFCNNGKMIAVAQNGNVFVFKSDLGGVLLQIESGLPETRAEFSPDCEVVAIIKGRDTVELYSIKKKELLKTVDGNPEGVNGCCFSPDGTWIAIASGGHPRDGGTSPGKVRVFEIKTGKLVAELD